MTDDYRPSRRKAWMEAVENDVEERESFDAHYEDEIDRSECALEAECSHCGAPDDQEHDPLCPWFQRGSPMTGM